MKLLMSIFLVLVVLFGNSQESRDISLSKTLDETRMGLWKNGDYDIYLEIEGLRKDFQNTADQYMVHAMDSSFTDSLVISYYIATANRYQIVATQLENAKNGFDLRSLNLYPGHEDDRQNTGNSRVIEDRIFQLVESGEAMIFYKDNRVYSLKYHSEFHGQIPNNGYSIFIYVDDSSNCALVQYHHLGW